MKCALQWMPWRDTVETLDAKTNALANTARVLTTA
ncbi:MAG: hypothetical protein CM15mP74_33970 [Halieaceae bacterium]|nr:MAG: hypothetical protein CM15mP74_33970 [Halieaceae bacterium]